MDLALTEHIINQVSYTSTAADSFCAVDGSVKVFFQTHAAKLDITGMKDESVQQLFMSYVNSTAADSFRAVDGSVKVFFQTHAAKLDITGMKDESVEQLFMSYVNSNGATIGTTIGDLINTN